jgi:outer membrane protein assembly factor BamE (lipoprotein component of BamABCDE complex)
MSERTVLTDQRSPAPAWKAACIVGLLAALLTLEGCFFFRSKPDPRVQEVTSQLSEGMTQEEVLIAVGSPQRRGQNLFDKRKEYWIYEFVSEQKKRKKRGSGEEENALVAELQLMFDRGKLVNWNVVSRQ